MTRNRKILYPVTVLLLATLIIISGSCNQTTGEAIKTTVSTTSPVITTTIFPDTVLPQTPAQTINNISVAETNALIQANAGNPDFIIIDVRTADEYATGHLANAINIDYSSDTFSQEISKLDRNKKYLIYCRTGVRSSGARDVMKGLGFLDINNMLDINNNKGGINEWIAEGFPVVK